MKRIAFAALIVLTAFSPLSVFAESSGTEQKLFASVRDYIARNSYPQTLNLDTCAPALRRALTALDKPGLAAEVYGKETRELQKVKCLDAFSGFARIVPGRPLSRGLLQGIGSSTADRTVIVVDIADVRYVHVSLFRIETATEFVNEVFMRRGIPAKVILDLRDNPGGRMDAALKIVAVFSPSSKSIAIRREYKNAFSWDDEILGLGTLKDTRTVILVNEGSASASEIVAGVLTKGRGVWKSDRRILMGTPTFGKGVFQEPTKVGKHVALWLTVGEYFIQGDRELGKVHGRGLEPDVLVRDSSPREIDRDPTIRMALKYLSQFK